MRNAARFAKGSGVYACRCCERNTRATGRGDNENAGLCAECFDLAGFENALSDNDELSAYEAEEVLRLIEVLMGKPDARSSCWADLGKEALSARNAAKAAGA